MHPSEKYSIVKSRSYLHRYTITYGCATRAEITKEYSPKISKANNWLLNLKTPFRYYIFATNTWYSLNGLTITLGALQYFSVLIHTQFIWVTYLMFLCSSSFKISTGAYKSLVTVISRRLNTVIILNPHLTRDIIYNSFV